MRKSRVIGYNIKKLAEEHGVSMEEVAGLLCHTEQQLKYVISGRGILDYKSIAILSKVFGISVDELLNSDNMDISESKGFVLDAVE